MRKVTLALVGMGSMLTAGQAMAQSSVIVGGIVDQYLGSLQYSGEPARRTVVNNGGMTTSWFGFRGSEQLGGKLKVEFALNGFFLGDTGASGRFGGDNLFSRDAFVALSGEFGKLTVGRTSAPTFLPSVLFNPFGDSFQFAPLILHTYVPTGAFGARKWVANTAGDSGWSNQVQYSTPVFGGVQMNVYYQPGEGLNNGGRNYAANAFYTKGALGLTMAVHRVRVSNPNGGLPILDATAAPVNYASINSQRGVFLGARYDAQVVKLFATLRDNDADSATGRRLSDRSYSLGLSVPRPNGAILAAYADTRRSGNLLVTDLKRNTLTVGYDHTLSKRTDWYTLAMADKISAAGRTKSFATGVRHRF
jgi:predicted porin